MGTMGKKKQYQKELAELFVKINDLKEMKHFFQEIFTTREIEDFSLRWQLLKELYEGKPQRSIAKYHKISLCKITRGSKILKKKNSIIKKILKKMYDQ